MIFIRGCFFFGAGAGEFTAAVCLSEIVIVLPGLTKCFALWIIFPSTVTRPAVSIFRNVFLFELGWIDASASINSVSCSTFIQSPHKNITSTLSPIEYSQPGCKITMPSLRAMLAIFPEPW